METHSFKAAYETGMAKISVMLGVYLFKEDNVFITYCPALDLSGYGYDEREAKLSFAEVMRQYLDYCLHKHTLVKDLQRLGWNIKSMKQRKIKSPDVITLLKRNPAFKDIMEHKDYAKYTEQLTIPELA